jgi:hypothetical protein
LAVTKTQFIVEVWEQTGQETVDAATLDHVQSALAERFGSEMSPASIARVLADHGARLGHPEVIQADVRWRETRRFALFTAEDLEVGTVDSANALVEKIERLRVEFAEEETGLEQLRQSVRELKYELERRGDLLAAEVAQWLGVWLQDPRIFGDWLELRRATTEFRERFGA